ncbi:MAG: hypothetical protein V4628_15490 [Pseudomonadota bacterium]
MKHKKLVEWVTRPLRVTVGKKNVDRPSFQSRFPGEELFLKLGQVMGDAARMRMARGLFHFQWLFLSTCAQLAPHGQVRRRQ